MSRKGCRKTLREIDDIIWVFKNTIAEDRPLFVARPSQTTNFIGRTFGCDKLLKDILLLRQEVTICHFGTTSFANDVEVDLIKNRPQSLSNISMQRNVNKKRGAFIDTYEHNSGPSGLPPMTNDGEMTGGSDL